MLLLEQNKIFPQKTDMSFVDMSFVKSSFYLLLIAQFNTFFKSYQNRHDMSRHDMS